MQQRFGPIEEDISTLFFDMDNTLFDLVGAKLAACKRITGEFGNVSPEELFRYFLKGPWGFEDFRNIRDFLRDQDCFSDENYTYCCRIYDAVKMGEITPYTGVPETLQELRKRGFRMGIISDAFSIEAKRRLEKTDLRKYFDLVVTCDLTGQKKPSPVPFQFALHKINAEISEVILIGDSPNRDMEPARKMGIRTVYARYGDRFSHTRVSTHADFVIDSIEELLPIIPGRAVFRKTHR